MAKLDLKTVQRGVLYPVAKIKHGMDSRADGSINPSKVDQLISQGTLFKRPLLTADGYSTHGRHGIVAAATLEGRDGKSATHIHVDVLTNVFYEKLTPEQAIEYRFFVVDGDKADSETGIRWPLTSEDWEHNIRNFVEAGVPLTEIVDNLVSPSLTVTRIKEIVTSVKASILQSKLSKASQEFAAVLAAQKNPNVKKILEKQGLDMGYACSISRTPQGVPPPPSKRTYKSMLKKQNALKQAGVSIHRYSTNNVRDVRIGHMDKAVAIRLANAHIAKAEDVLKAAQDGLARIERL